MHKSKILAASRPDGNVDAVQALAQEAHNLGASAIALLGSLTPKNADPREYARVLKALAEAQLPAFYIPGPEDAPFSEFLREAANFELVYHHVRGIHTTFAMGPDHVLWSGFGGTVEDDPHGIHEEVETLRYPGWEIEYRLKFLQELKEYEKIFLFATAPEHKGLHQRGSSVLAEMIKTYKPRAVFVGGQEREQVMIGTSWVVALGSLAEGHYTLADVRTRELTHGSLRQPIKAA